MRILFASANFDDAIVGGAQLSLRIVAEQLVRDGHEVAVASVDPRSLPRSSPVIAAAATPALSTFKLPAGNVYWHRAPRPNGVKRLLWHSNDRFGRWLLPAFGRVLDQFRPDVVHSNVLSGLTVSVWTAARARNVPIVHSVHDYYLLCVNSGMRSGRGNCQRPCLGCRAFTGVSQREAKNVAAVIYVSEHMRSAHERARVFAPDTHASEVIGAFASERKRAARAAPAAFAERRLRIGFLGRLAPDKGLERLLRELESLARESYVLKIGGVGAESYEHKLRALAQGMPVEFLGRVVAADFFESIDILVVPSTWHEPAARVVYEAGLSGVPVVVTARGGLPQLVGFGERGWIYEPEQPGELLGRLRAIQHDPAEVTRKIERWSACASEFSPAAVTARTLLCYDAAIEVERRRRSSRARGALSTAESP